MKFINSSNWLSFFLIFSSFMLFPNTLHSQNVLDTVYIIDKKILSPEEEWRLKAKEDMSKGNYYLLDFGMAVHMVDLWEITKLTRKYGFTYKYEGCVYPSGGKEYNKIVMKHLDSLNGEGWYNIFLYEYKMLQDSAFNSLNNK